MNRFSDDFKLKIEKQNELDSDVILKRIFMRFVRPLEVSWGSVGRCLGVPGVVLGSEFGVIF